MRETPDWITELKDNEIFVFGSNLSGRHGKGAAKTAIKWGAVWGNPRGLQGKTYGIPTVNASITKKLSLDDIEKEVDLFYNDCIKHRDLKFLVTEVGCGLAGWTVKEIAPLFRIFIDLDNVYLPKNFLKELTK